MTYNVIFYAKSEYSNSPYESDTQTYFNLEDARADIRKYMDEHDDFWCAEIYYAPLINYVMIERINAKGTHSMEGLT